MKTTERILAQIFITCCVLIQNIISYPQPQATDLCNPSPCGANTKCRVDDGRAVCSCQSTYIGNPIQGCKHECEVDTDCASNLGCIKFRCKDPCKMANACSAYAICEVVNQKADCRCPSDYLGDGFTYCEPECSQQSDCPAYLACIGHKCGDPCENPKACGKNAECRVNLESHKTICKCPSGWKGHPFEACHPPGGG